MSLNKDFFDNISIELVKRKYYNANKVDALLEDIRGRAAALLEENSRLAKELAGLSSQKAEIAEAVMSARLLHSEIIQKAENQAGETLCRAQDEASAIISRAENRAQEIIREAEERLEENAERLRAQEDEAARIESRMADARARRQEYAVEKVEKCFSDMRRQYNSAIEALNAQWQDFLCGLDDEDGAELNSSVQAVCEESAPADVQDKLRAIAGELEELSGDN